MTKPILDSIDGISKSCLSTLDVMKTQNFESRSVFEKLGSLIDYNQVGTRSGLNQIRVEQIISSLRNSALHD